MFFDYYFSVQTLNLDDPSCDPYADLDCEILASKFKNCTEK